MTKGIKGDFFATRWGFLFTLIGTAIGAGNIWRFSRIAAQNGGGSFLIPWIIFLFLWSIPLIIAEIAMGKMTRKGPIGALALIAGKRFGWMGGFIALVATCILFYYSVIVGWGFSYFYMAITGTLTASTTHLPTLWNSYTNSLYPLVAHTLAILVAGFIVFKGIHKGIERSNQILMPALFALILILLVRSLLLEGAWTGIEYLFTPNLKTFLNWHVWMEALTQNAWDTGAGWGFFLVFACFAKKEESITLNGALTALSNNAISLIMGIIIFSTAFALQNEAGIHALTEGVGSNNFGLAFIFLPELFRELPGGWLIQTLFASLFFLAFSFAALSSMISMLQLTTHVLNELGISRLKALIAAACVALILGAPSALSLKFMENQDWVWGMGLIVSGLFISFGALRFGLDRYRRLAVNTAPHDLKVGKVYNILIALVPVESLILLGWYFYSSEISLAPVFWQWGVALTLLLLFNRQLVKRSLT